MKTIALPLLAALFIGSGTALAEGEDPVVKAALDQLGYKYDIKENGDFHLTFTVEDDRTQLMVIRSLTQDYQGYKVRQVYSMAYKAPEKTGKIPTPILKSLLMENSTSKMGAWEIDTEGTAAYYTVRLAADAKPEAIDAAINAVINSADAMEKKLTGKDDW
ncbi:MAG: YbjN domain-containing protein [Akkermansiaceae bacterium]|jgi:hypothetical protein|nr:YbjN domain-containing protein [Akkermansiaceae bacterium]